ncbi:peptidoglycan recognition protein family protein [Pseudonocardia nigra]|uniref:peptidoglycan recognition protein family protein n=1 Tax=Pseudonocardia nigra TaxID=1921578 RepID=UPI001FEC6652|nr:N-acetylmuramoyl-L-alanine amidase [Pseudonocardia nigra]
MGAVYSSVTHSVLLMGNNDKQRALPARWASDGRHLIGVCGLCVVNRCRIVVITDSEVVRIEAAGGRRVEREGVSRRRVLLGGLAVAGTVTGTIGAGRATAVPSPPIIGTSGWGARPNSAIVPVWNQRPIKIIVHHTATPNQADFSRAAADTLARAIQNFHMDRRGWIDTGQHFTISRGGFVLEGRHRSLEVLRIGRQQVEGAHTTGQNIVAVGIENEGIYTVERPPGELWNRLRELCAYICQQYAIRPTEIFGHRDFKDTACPGDVLYGMLPQLRAEVAGLLGQHLSRDAAVQASWPLLRIADRGAAVRAAQHLLRAAGLRIVDASGEFDRTTADAVRQFQTEQGTEEVNGMIGGESWPLLVRVVRPDDDGEAALAVQALTSGGGLEAPTMLGVEEWKQLLSHTTTSP